MTIFPARTIVLTVVPSLNSDSRKAYSERGQLFDAAVDGRCIVKRSPTPFCEAARALLREGVRPDTKLVMRHEGKHNDALISTVGVAAKTTVVTPRMGKPAFAQWQPHPGFEQSSAGASPMRQTDEAAPRVPSAPERSHELAE
jgi:hypothetical protein